MSNDLTIRQGFDSSIGPAGDAWLSYTLSSGSGTNFLDVVSANRIVGHQPSMLLKIPQVTSAISDIEVLLMALFMLFIFMKTMYRWNHVYLMFRGMV